jgi:hypothetical protein
VEGIESQNFIRVETRDMMRSAAGAGIFVVLAGLENG